MSAESAPQSPGTPAFGSLLPPAPLTWLSLPPASEDPWTDDATSVLMDVWSSHMDAHLQQWMNKHGGMEFSATVSQLACGPMWENKRSGIVAILRGAKTPLRVFNKPVEEEGGFRPALRCTVQRDNDRNPPPHFQDAVIPHMLSLQYISKKMGLAKHVLQATSNGVDKIHLQNDYNL